MKRPLAFYSLKMSQITKEALSNWNSYHIPGQQKDRRIKRNAIFINSHNSIKHELWKSIGSILIHRYGDIKATEDLKEAVKSLSNIIEIIYKDFPLVKSSFITECVPNDEPDRRVDLVNLETNDRFEFESSKAVNKKDSITIYI